MDGFLSDGDIDQSEQWLVTLLTNHGAPLTGLYDDDEEDDVVSVEFAQLKLLEYFCGWEDAGVDDACNSEGSSNNSTDGGEEMVEWRPLLVIPHSDGVQIIPETIIRYQSVIHQFWVSGFHWTMIVN